MHTLDFTSIRTLDPSQEPETGAVLARVPRPGEAVPRSEEREHLVLGHIRRIRSDPRWCGEDEDAEEEAA